MGMKNSFAVKLYKFPSTYFSFAINFVYVNVEVNKEYYVEIDFFHYSLTIGKFRHEVE